MYVKSLNEVLQLKLAFPELNCLEAICWYLLHPHIFPSIRSPVTENWIFYRRRKLNFSTWLFTAWKPQPFTFSFRVKNTNFCELLITTKHSWVSGNQIYYQKCLLVLLEVDKEIEITSRLFTMPSSYEQLLFPLK